MVVLIDVCDLAEVRKQKCSQSRVGTTSVSSVYTSWDMLHTAELSTTAAMSDFSSSSRLADRWIVVLAF